MTVADEVAVGWCVSEEMLPGGDYEPRGGIVVDVWRDGPDETVREVRTLRVFRGRLLWADLGVGRIDWALAQRPAAATISPVLMVMVRDLARALVDKRTIGESERKRLVLAGRLAELL